MIYLYLAAFKETFVEFIMKSIDKIGMMDQYKTVSKFRVFQDALNQLHHEDYAVLLPIAGILLNLALLMSTRNLKHYIVASFMLWSFKMCLKDIPAIHPYLDSINVSLSSKANPNCGLINCCISDLHRPCHRYGIYQNVLQFTPKDSY